MPPFETLIYLEQGDSLSYVEKTQRGSHLPRPSEPIRAIFPPSYYLPCLPCARDNLGHVVTGPRIIVAVAVSKIVRLPLLPSDIPFVPRVCQNEDPLVPVTHVNTAPLVKKGV